MSYSFVARLWSNWITLLGAVLTTCSGLAIVALLAVEFASTGSNPYANIFLLAALPVLFVAGLLLIPLGLWIDRRRREKLGVAFEANPALEAVRNALRKPAARKLALFFAGATLVNVALFGVGGQQVVHHMDSPQFCGKTCHVMTPEWTSYSGSRHSRVACVQCHIGPGASWAVRSKINGLKQVWGVLSGTYDRPIPTPVEHLRPSRDTCEQCHWPEKFTGNKLVVFPHFGDDAANTPAWNVMMMRVGGRDPKTREYGGIHWHVSANARIEYEQLDDKRSKIGTIRVYQGDELVSEYLPREQDRGLEVLQKRTMDCVDCHNRPTHVFDESPAAAVDRAMAGGQLDAKAPFLVATSRAVLSSPPADGNFRAAIEARYRSSHPDVKVEPAVLDQAGRTLAELYGKNVYPKMNVSWGTYRSRLGHQHEGDKGDEIGCFRCHDNEHEKKLAGGGTKRLRQSCEECHEQLVAGEDPAKLEAELKQLLPR